MARPRGEADENMSPNGGPADGWFGALTVQGFRESSPFDFDKVIVICSPIG
jgi:hypothetical protein